MVKRIFKRERQARGVQMADLLAYLGEDVDEDMEGEEDGNDG